MAKYLFRTSYTQAGTLTVSTTVLLSPETIDGAVKKSVPYRAPGD